MKNVLFLILTITMLCLSGCKMSSDTPYDQESNILFSEPTLKLSNMRYFQKYTELVNKYGEAEVVTKTITEDKQYSYLEGVCITKLFDFNGDGTQDLFMVYSNGQYTGKQQSDIESDEYDISIPQASSYEIEIWTVKDGELTQLLHKPKVGDYLSFGNEFWDTDNCMITIYKKSDGLPVIQLYDKSKKWIGYTNLYWRDDGFVSDKLTYRKGSFTLNGKSISQETWSERVTGYNTILYLAHLSNPHAIVDYSIVLRQSKETVRTLSQGELAHTTPVQAEYISLYLREIDQANREHSNPDYYNVPVSYYIYDIDKNGTPELLIKNGNCEAAYFYEVFTVSDGEIVHCGKFGGAHTSLHTGKPAGLVRYEAHMMVYTIEFITLEGTKLKIERIADGSVEKEKWEEGYPELNELGYGVYDQFVQDCYVTTPMELYMYERK